MATWLTLQKEDVSCLVTGFFVKVINQGRYSLKRKEQVTRSHKTALSWVNHRINIQYYTRLVLYAIYFKQSSEQMKTKYLLTSEGGVNNKQQKYQHFLLESKNILFVCTGQLNMNMR